MPEDLNLHLTDHLVDTSCLIATNVRYASGAVLHQACRLLLWPVIPLRRLCFFC